LRAAARRRSRGFRQYGHSCSTWPERRGPWCSRGAVQLMSSRDRMHHGCHVGRSPPTRFVFSFTHSLTISVISYEHWPPPEPHRQARWRSLQPCTTIARRADRFARRSRTQAGKHRFHGSSRAGFGETRSLGHVAFKAEAAEPAIGEIEMNLFDQPTFRADAVCAPRSNPEWRRLHRMPPPMRLSRDLLTRGIWNAHHRAP